jgi:hypothetical protein
MQEMARQQRRWWSVAAVCTLLFALLALQGAAVRPAAAQEATATPTDPIWLAFSAARSAVEEEFSVNLSLVRNWDWSQQEFAVGINDCITPDNIFDLEPLYFGWRFVITDVFGKQYEARTSFDRTVVVVCPEVTVVAAAGTPAPDGNLPPPVAGAALAGGFELGGHVLELNTGTVNTMRSARMVWVKRQFRYQLGQDPSAVASYISSARANGLKILIGIVGETNQMGDLNSYINSFATFLGGVAALGPDAIEVWNEPNIDREWPAGQISGANYTRMLAAAYNAIKTSNPNVLVISGAPAPTGFFGAAGCAAAGCNDDAFMQQMAAAGAAQYMDCVGLHYNEGIVSPSTQSGDSRGEYPTYYFNSMLSRGYSPFGGKPVCWTELGFLSPEGYSDPLPGNFAWGANTSVSEQAAWLAEAASRSAQSGRVRLMIVWNVDFPFFTATDPVGGYAIIRPGGACPACSALATVMGG